MNLPTNAGRYIATPVEWTVGNSKNNLPQFVCRFGISQFNDGTEWIDVSGQNLEITGYFNLVYMKDGQQTLNQINIDQIKAALAWDGTSFGKLAELDWSGIEVQLYLQEEEYNGKSSMRIKYLNPRDYEGGGFQKADPQEIQSLDAKYGAMLRATNGNGHGKPATKPATKPTAKPAAAPTGPAHPAEAAKSVAWKEYSLKVEAYGREQPDGAYTREKKQEVFRKIVAECFPAKDPKTLDAKEWGMVEASITKDFNAATGELVPF